jgi:hypothetical protein
VYNKVEVKVEETFLNQVTTKEYDFAKYLEDASSQHDPIEALIEKDFFVESNLLSERYSLNVNNALPTSKN